MRRIRTFTRWSSCVVWETDADLNSPSFARKSPCFQLHIIVGLRSQSTLKGKIVPNLVFVYRYCVMKLTERLKKEGIDINLRDALGVDTDPKLRNLRGKL